MDSPETPASPLSELASSKSTPTGNALFISKSPLHGRFPLPNTPLLSAEPPMSPPRLDGPDDMEIVVVKGSLKDLLNDPLVTFDHNPESR